jgi:hypothetical protein
MKCLQVLLDFWEIFHAARDAGGVREQVMDRDFFSVEKVGDEFRYCIVATQQFFCSRRRTAAAVNCFETDAMRNLVWGVLVTANSQLAMP